MIFENHPVTLFSGNKHIVKNTRLVLTFVTLAAMVFMVFGYFAAFQILRKQHKSEIKQLLRTGGAKELQQEFTLTPAEYKLLDWKDEKEFSMHGNMYDVLNTEVLASGNYHLICHRDLDDQTIFNFLIRYHKGNTGNDQHHQTIKLLQLLSLADIVQQSNLWTASHNLQHETIFINRFQTSFEVKPSTPPPQI